MPDNRPVNGRDPYSHEYDEYRRDKDRKDDNYTPRGPNQPPGGIGITPGGSTPGGAGVINDKPPTWGNDPGLDIDWDRYAPNPSKPGQGGYNRTWGTPNYNFGFTQTEANNRFRNLQYAFRNSQRHRYSLQYPGRPGYKQGGGIIGGARNIEFDGGTPVERTVEPTAMTPYHQRIKSLQEMIEQMRYWT